MTKLKKKKKTTTSSVVRIFIVLLVVVVHQSSLVSFCFFIDDRQSPGHQEWNYANQHEWPHEHRQCAGNAQSPINIQARNVISSNHLKLLFYNYNQLIKFKLQNAHHTVKMNPIETSYLLAPDESSSGHLVGHGRAPEPANSLGAGNDSNSSLADALGGAVDDLETEFETTREPKFMGRGQAGPSRADVKGYGSGGGGGTRQQLNGQTVGGGGGGEGSNEEPAYGGAPTIKLDWLDDGNNEYKLRDIHFHWGERRDNGSEHAIDGKRAAMEMHLVHIKHGLEKSKIGFTSDSVAVIAVLVDSNKKSNSDFNPIVNALGRINMTDQAQEIEYKALGDLLPSTKTYFYTYSGSLTTPPCYQVVNWIVLRDRLLLNAKQIEMFRNLYAPQASTYETNHELLSNLIMPNIRQTQPLSNRTILASFSPYGRLEQIQIANTPMNGATSMLFIMDGSMLMLLMALIGASVYLTTKRCNYNILDNS